ncbi:MAG: sulfatase-like hydrolase/transferase [Anaerolineae bacterium]|nr:sulfatase-like hydrolase/transferase [Anaerolineae bacterium]
MSQTRPNVLWICTDQQRFDTVHALGNAHIRTPNLDRLVAEGVAFTRAFSQSPICTPSRASFLTGCYPSTLHVNRNGNSHFPSSELLITRRLADIGYDCGLVGKLHLAGAHGRVEPRWDDPARWDGYRVFKWSHHPDSEAFWPTKQHAYQQWLADQGIDWHAAYNAGRADLDDWPKHAYSRTGIASEYHQTTWCANEAIAFMCEQRDGSWLMSVNPFDPHPRFDPPAEYLARMNVDEMPLPLFQPEELESQLDFQGIDHQTERPIAPQDYAARHMVAAYYAQIEQIDDQVGRMLDALEASGQRENTIVIFTSDHGEMLGDHGLLWKGCRFYEGAVHVPLILSWPGHFQAGLRSEALVELTDLAPTLYEALGLPIPDFVQGKSLLPILNGEQAPHQHREFVRCEYHDALDRAYASHANMILDGKFKLVVYHGHQIGELYDLEHDPSEFHNLWDDPSSQSVKYAKMKQIFDAVMLATDAGQPRVGRY